MLPVGTRVDWNRYEQLIYKRFGVNAVTFDKNGCRITAGAFLWANDLCKLIKTNLNAKKLICDAVQQQMIHESQAIKRYVTNECSAGIYRRLFPIIRDHEIEGFFSVCGRPFSSSQLMYVEYIHEITGMEPEKIKKLISTVIPISPRTIKEMTCFITSEVFPKGFYWSPQKLHDQ